MVASSAVATQRLATLSCLLSSALAQTPLVACGGDDPSPLAVHEPPKRLHGGGASVEKKLAVAQSLGRKRHPPSGPRPAQPVVMS